MIRGRVDWYSAALGYGFILPNNESARALVRQENVLDEEPESLKNGANVTYEAVQGTEGVEARNARCV